MNLTDHQGRAAKTVVSKIKAGQPLTTLFGFAGTGKSTILPNIVQDLGYALSEIAFVAPTGKAAKVMREKLRAQGFDNPNVSTIHSAIYRAKPAPISTLENEKSELQHTIFQLATEGCGPEHADVKRLTKMVKRLEAELESAYLEDKLHFQLNPDSSIAMAQLIVLDEASMVGGRMTEDLMQFGVPIFAMGDPGQLPPIEDTGGICAMEPDAFLTEVHRQAADNPIIRLATLARRGEEIPFGDYDGLVQVVRRKEYDPDIDCDDPPKFICGTNKTRWKINQNLREDLGIVSRAGDRVGPMKGEPLIICKNNKTYPNLVNGTEAVASADHRILTPGHDSFYFSFESEDGVPYQQVSVFQGMFEEHFSRQANGFTADKRSAWQARKKKIVLDWGYAITCHKSQGSQWDEVVVIDESPVFRKDEDKWLYTAVTRAAQRLTILR